MHSHINFGYPWQMLYGHFLLAALALPLFVLAIKRKWSKWFQTIAGALAFWSFAAFLVVQFGFRLNQTTGLPTESFFKSGTGKVLDMGAGTGRSSLMVLQARPNATLVALDQFGASYEGHFGVTGNQNDLIDIGVRKLTANFEAAGVESRASVQAGDMRNMPLDAASFDAAVSAYAIDHLSRAGIGQALSEASRVLKPGGEFLLIVINKDLWLNFTFGPLMIHGRMPSQQFWVDYLGKAGFEVKEMGTQPGTFYFLARKP
jgi:ubiquinone/menaquinone biosynthesis C-methylase UbiE